MDTLVCGLDWTPLILFDYIKLKLSTPPPFCQFLQHIVSLHSCFVLLEVSSAGVQHMHEQILSLHRHWADQKLLAVGFLSLVTESIIGTSAMIHSTAASLSRTLKNCKSQKNNSCVTIKHQPPELNKVANMELAETAVPPVKLLKRIYLPSTFTCGWHQQKNPNTDSTHPRHRVQSWTR